MSGMLGVKRVSGFVLREGFGRYGVRVRARMGCITIRQTLPRTLPALARHYAQPPGGAGGGFPGLMMQQHQKGDALKEYVS